MAETSLRWDQPRPIGSHVFQYSLDGEVGLTDHLGGAARGEKADIVLDQTFGQVEQTGLVVDGQDG